MNPTALGGGGYLDISGPTTKKNFSGRTTKVPDTPIHFFLLWFFLLSGSGGFTYPPLVVRTLKYSYFCVCLPNCSIKYNT